jgi:hypothetical protein
VKGDGDGKQIWKSKAHVVDQNRIGRHSIESKETCEHMLIIVHE